MAKYTGKLGMVAVGLTIITKLDFGRSSCHLAANGSGIADGGTTEKLISNKKQNLIL